jgi:outer membrane autotransporter protein
VGGAANLGGTVRVLNTGNVKIKRGEKLTFLTATNGVNGKFANETLAEFGGDTLLKSDIVYKSNSVEITTKLGSFASDIGGLTENQTAVARQLDKANSAGQADELLDFLSTEEVGKLPADLDKIAPEELTSFFRIGTSLANVQNGNLERRMSDVRAGAEGFSANGYSTGGSRPSSGRDRAYSGGERSSTDGQPNYYSGATAYGPTGEGGREMRAPGPPIPIGVFITGVGEFTNVGDDSTARGYDLTTGGFTLGVDFKLTPNFVFGINAGYARTGADLTGDGRVTVDGAKAGVYATYFTGTGFYVDAAVNGGYNNYDSRRGALQGTAVGSTSGTEINALIGTGYDWRRGDFSIGPVASVQYTHVKVSGFRERGSLAPLNIAGNSGESLRTALGVKTSYDIRPLGTGMVIRPEVRAAWQHEFADSSFALDSRLANGAGNTFTVRGPEIGDDSLLVGAGVAVLWNERTSTYVYYDGEFGRSNSSSNNFSGGVRLTF